MKRGDIVTVALSGDLGKPRPALILESDLLAPTRHVIICPGTSFVRDDVEQRRVQVEPDPANGLKVPTQFQIDRLISVQRTKCGPVIGRLDAGTMDRLNATLFVVVGLAD